MSSSQPVTPYLKGGEIYIALSGGGWKLGAEACLQSQHPAFGRWRQENQEFKAIFNSNEFEATWDYICLLFVLFLREGMRKTNQDLKGLPVEVIRLLETI